MIKPLAIIQARFGSTRLPGKVLMEVGGRSLIRRAWDASVEAFGEANVVFAIPATPENDELHSAIVGFTPEVFRWDGGENDVLGRFWHCAHRYRWHPDSVIVRVTPDDPFKDPAMMRRVAAGERLPVELGAEAFTLAMLGEAHEEYFCQPRYREHITKALFHTPPPAPPPGIWTIDTREDLEAAQYKVNREYTDPLEGL